MHARVQKDASQRSKEPLRGTTLLQIEHVMVDMKK